MLFNLTRILRHKRVLFLLLIIYGAMHIYNWAMKEYGNAGSLNYFIEEKDFLRGDLKYIIETPNCQILKMSPWEPAILPFIKSNTLKPDCVKQSPRNWTYIQNTKIFLNKTGILESGYSLQSLRCCYKGILRVEQSLTFYDWNADNKVKYTSECHPISSSDGGTSLNYEFIRVLCICTSWPFNDQVVYREFYAVAQPTKESSERKIQLWSSKNSTRPSPPNVVMIGFDSLSRMNFHRSFHKTQALLDSIGAIEFLGYTKIGENTFPNTAAFLSGYDHLDLALDCMKSWNLPQDHCPYIWKRFNDANYLTATIEDAPGLVGFNYMKLGFVEQPTDFYFRPFMLAVHKSLPRKDYYHTDCIGRLTTEQTVLNYISGIMDISSKTSTPVFIHSWMTSLTHLDINGAKYADDNVASFLQSLDLSNTILIFLSDHGQRYGAIRETLAGWYEDKLPIMSVYLPPTVRKDKPSWAKTLQENAQRLTSPYDLFKMMNDVIDEYNPEVPPLKEIHISSQPESITNNMTSVPVSVVVSRKGQSLFTPISNHRRCSDAPISVNYCACLPPLKLNATDPRLLLAVEAALNYLNKQIPEQCSRTTIHSIIAGALMSSSSKHAGEFNISTFVATFYTSPGQFLFEATVDYIASRSEYVVTTDLLRMNKIDRDTSCVKDPLLERYCYCK